MNNTETKGETMAMDNQTAWTVHSQLLAAGATEACVARRDRTDGSTTFEVEVTERCKGGVVARTLSEPISASEAATVVSSMRKEAKARDKGTRRRLAVDHDKLGK